MKRLLGVKKQMTQIFADDGSIVPVTIVDIKDNFIIAEKKPEGAGYQSLVLGMGKKKRASKTEQTKYKELGFVPEFISESRDEQLAEATLGARIVEDLTNKTVAVTGVTKGKGFQGGMKRWNFSGTKQTHGQSDRMRAPGSIGSGTTPGRVYKGKHMAGRMGGDTKTIKNLKVVKHIQSEQLLLIRGAVPGAVGSKLILHLAS